MGKKIIGIVSKPNILKNDKKVLCVMSDFYNITKYYDVIIISILPIYNLKNLNTVLGICDGFILQGGTEAYQHEKEVLKYAIKYDKPILGICMGMQLMASLYDNNLEIINDKYNNHDINDYYAHEICIDKKSKLFKIMGKNKIMVNSTHKEHIINSGIYKISSYSDDGIIESIEYNKNKFNIGVQFHPERLLNDSNISKLFKYFINCL